MTSGWCSAPAGARPQHGQCRSAVCGCECHTNIENQALTKGSEHQDAVDFITNNEAPAAYLVGPQPGLLATNQHYLKGA